MRTWLTAAALLVATGTAAQYRPAPPMTVLTDSDDGRVLNLAVGTEVVVRLPENEGTAFRWMLRNESRVEQLGGSTTDGPDNRGIVGGRRFRTFRLLVREPGRFPLIFGLRTTAGDAAPARRVLFTLNVADDGRGRSEWNDEDSRRSDRDDDRRRPDWRRAQPPLMLGEADSHRRIEVERGRDVVIRLPDNSSTGYRWEVSGQPDNFDVIERLTVQRGPQPGGAIGGAGVATIRLRPQERGHAYIAIALFPPTKKWISTSSRILSYNFDIR